MNRKPVDKEKVKDEVIDLYVNYKFTFRMIADKIDSNHHMVRRILLANKIPLCSTDRYRKPCSEETKKKIGDTNRGRVCKPRENETTECVKRIHMKNKLKIDIDLDLYPDYYKLNFLSLMATKRKSYYGITDENLADFLDKFYYDEEFNLLYEEWIKHNKETWWKPSLDHRQPISRGGSTGLDNLRFLTWFENKTKSTLNEEEWINLKRISNMKCDLFIEEIIENNKRK